MKEDSTETDKWGGFIYAKGPATQGFLVGHLQSAAQGTKGEGVGSFTLPPYGLNTVLAQ